VVKKRSPAFFKDLLVDTYIDKIVAYTDEKIVFTKEVLLTKETVEVHSMVIKQTQEVPIYYSVINENAHGWSMM